MMQKSGIVLLFFTLLFHSPLNAQVGADDISNFYEFRGRTYILDLPSGEDKDRKLPLIIVLHGATGNALSIKRSLVHNMRQVMDKNGFMVAYLNGSRGRLSRKRRTWNAGLCCGSAVFQARDDVEYIRRFIKHALKRHNADPRRVYLLGYSNGAMMAYRYICEHADTVTAIVAISGTLMNGKCHPGSLKGILHIHGGEDRIVPLEGGRAKVGPFRTAYYMPISDVQTLMREAGVPFTFKFLETAGHRFDQTKAQINIAWTAWRFFRELRR